MKKLLWIYILILLSVFIGLSLFDSNGDYEAERALVKINAQFSEYSKDPKTIPTGTFEEIRKKYEHFVSTHPDSKLILMAQLHIGHTYMAMKDYDKARAYFENFINKHKSDQILGVQAAVEITRTYALEQNEAGVLKSYDRIMRDFGLTDIGLKTPLLVVDFYKNSSKKSQARAQKALEDAEKYYKDIILKHENSILEFKALELLANCHMIKVFRARRRGLRSDLPHYRDR